MRLCDRLDVDPETASQVYFLCLLFYVGCTAPADIGLDIFGDDDALTTYATRSRFGSRAEVVVGFMRAIAPPVGPPQLLACQIARGPKTGPRVSECDRYLLRGGADVDRQAGSESRRLGTLCIWV